MLARPREGELPDRLPRQLPLPEEPREGERPEGVGEGVGLAHRAARPLAERDRREPQGQLERQVGGDDGEGREELAPRRQERREAGVGPLGRRAGAREAPVPLARRRRAARRAAETTRRSTSCSRSETSGPGQPWRLVVDEPRQLLREVLPPEGAGRGVGRLPLGERGEGPGGQRRGPRAASSASFGSVPGSGGACRLGRGRDDEGPRLGRLEEEREERRGGAVGEVEVVDEDDERPVPRLGAARRLERGEDLVEEREAARLLGEARDGGRVGAGGGEARDAGEGRARGGPGRAAAAREGREDVEDRAGRGSGPRRRRAPRRRAPPPTARGRATRRGGATCPRPPGRGRRSPSPTLPRRDGAPARSGRGARRGRRREA